jgi:hypothetical protein
MPLEFSPFLMPIKNADFLSDATKYLAEGNKDAAAQAAAKAKTDKEIKLFEINPNDYKTGTVADKMLVGDIQSVQDKANALYKAGYNQTEAKIALSDDIFRITKNYQAAQNLSKKLNSGLEKIKGVKGIRPDKYESEYIKNAFYNPDGTQKKELDDSKDYDADVRQFGDIYNMDEAVAADVQSMAKNSETRDVQERGANGVLRKVKKEIETATGFEPSIDKQGVFEGVVPKHIEAPVTDASKAVNDYITGQTNSTQPLNLITDDNYKRVQSNDVIMGAVNRDTRKFADEMSKTQGRVPTPEETDIFQKAKLFDIYKRASNAGFAHKTLQAQLAPVTKVTVNTGGGSKGAPTIRDIYKNVSDSFAANTREDKPYLQLNLLDEDSQKIIVDAVNDKKKVNNIPQENIYIKKDPKSGDLYAMYYDIEKGQSPFKGEGDYIVKVGKSLNIKATPGTAGKSAAVVQTNEADKTKTSPKKGGYKGTKNKMY